MLGICWLLWLDATFLKVSSSNLYFIYISTRNLAEESTYFKGINRVCREHGTYLTFLLRCSSVFPYYFISYLLSVTHSKSLLIENSIQSAFVTTYSETTECFFPLSFICTLVLQLVKFIKSSLQRIVRSNTSKQQFWLLVVAYYSWYL